MKNNKQANTKGKKKKRSFKVIIGVFIGIFLLCGATFIFAAREAPRFDKHMNAWDKIVTGIWHPFDWDHYRRRQLEEKTEYSKRYSKIEKNTKKIELDGAYDDNNQKNVLNILRQGWGNDGSMQLKKIHKDPSLSNSQNKKIDAEIKSKYNRWLKHNPKPSQAMAQYQIMKITEEAYSDVLGANHPKVKSLDKISKKLKLEAEKTNKKRDKEVGKEASGEPTSLKGKIAQAILHLFYSDAIGEWMQSSGPGCTIFAVGYTSGQTGKETFSKIAESYNQNVFNEVFAPTADTRTVSKIGEQLTPIFICLSAVLIVLIVIMQAGKMGWGQAFNSFRSREEWYHNLVDTAIAVVGCCNYGLLIQLLLTINGGIVLGIAGIMAGTSTESGHTVMREALTLGFNQSTINMLTNGTFLGEEFVGIIFSIIYILTYIGLAVYLKYYYFIREIVFVILFTLGPIFIAFWPTHWGKGRTLAWLKEMCGTIFIQSIHALTMMFVAALMAWNNENWVSIAADSAISAETPTQSAGKTLARAGREIIHGGLIFGIQDTVKSGLQIFGLFPSQSAKAGALHFEVMVIGFIILILFQPLSKSLAELFGIETNMLDNLHKSTSNTLQTAALVAGGAIVGGAALGLAATSAGGLSLASGTKALGSAAKAAKFAKAGNKVNAFKQAFGKSFNRGTKLNKLRSQAAKTMARLNGIVGKSAGQAAMYAFGTGLNANPATMIAMTRAGGEIGDRAASLASGGLSKLGLKNADPTRQQKEELSKSLNDATKNATNKATTTAIDKAAGLQEQIQKLKANPNLAHDKKAQETLAAMKQTLDFMKEHPLDSSQAATAQASRLLNGKNNYKDAQAINNAIRNMIDADPNLSAEQKADMKQAADKAMIMAGSSAYDPKIAFDKAGYADAQAASEKAKKSKMAELKGKYNAGKLPNVPRFDQMSFDEWKDSDQFKSDYAPLVEKAGSTAAQAALERSNGHVYGTIDDAAFQEGLKHDDGAIINSDIFKQEFASRLKGMGIYEPNIHKLTSATDGIAGRSLVQEVPELSDNGMPAQILDSGLWSRLNAQAANTVNATWGGRPVVTANDFDNTYNASGYNVYGALVGDNTAAPTAQDISHFVQSQEKAACLEEGHKNWSEFSNLANLTAQNYDSANPVTWFTNPSQKAWEHAHPEFMAGTTYSKGFGNYGVAQNRITATPTPEPTAWGMSLSSAYQMMSHSAGNIKPGAFRMKIQNTQSVLQAADENGNWFMVGNVGRGDGMLEAGQTVYQDLDLSPDGIPSLRYDANNHTVAAPYTLQGNERIPATLTNGIPELTSFFSNPQFKDSYLSNPSDFQHMQRSYILNRSAAADMNPTFDQYSNYTDFALQGNNSSYVITGINSNTGQREALTFSTTRAPELGGMPTNTSFFIPLKDNGETGLDISPLGNSHIFYEGNIKESDRQLADKVFKGFLSDQSRIDKVNSYLHDSVLPYTKPYLRNFIANNPAYMSGTNLDTFYKSLYE